MSDFGGTKITQGVKHEEEPEDVRSFIARAALSNKDKAFLCAALNNEQFEKYGKIFREEGWDYSEAITHPAHGTTIRILIKNINRK